MSIGGEELYGWVVGGTVTTSAAPVDLAAEGSADWVHWGDASLTRKAGVTAQLSDYTVVGPGTVLPYADDLREVSAMTTGLPVLAVPVRMSSAWSRKLTTPPA